MPRHCVRMGRNRRGKPTCKQFSGLGRRGGMRGLGGQLTVCNEYGVTTDKKGRRVHRCKSYHSGPDFPSAAREAANIKRKYRYKNPRTGWGM